METIGTATRGQTLSALFLVAGCCIGGGMLALPVATGVNGFWPSMIIMAFCWLAMTTSALLLLEASLWMEEGAHVITMASRLLGKFGKGVSWILYLFIAYASLVAYTAGAGAQLVEGWNSIMPFTISSDLGSALFLLIFSVVIFVGGQFVGSVNSMLFIAMIIAYFGLIALGADEVNPAYLVFNEWNGALLAVPLLLTAFSFQTMVPSLTPLLKGDARALRTAIIGGTLTAFIAYALWQALILGIVPVEGPGGLREALQKGVPATIFLRQHVGGQWIVLVAEFFAFFAIVTSFLGIGLGLWDFLADGLHISKKGSGKWVLAALFIVPILVCATQFERVFYVALETTGGYGDTILNGIIPALMVWFGRYRIGYTSTFRVWGGKTMLILVIAAFSSALAIEIYMQAMGSTPPTETLDFIEPDKLGI